MRTCINDNDAKTACGAQSPQSEQKTVSCSGPPCPIWGAWSGYVYGQCSQTCGDGATKTGVRKRKCLNDNQFETGCGAKSPQSEQTTEACQLMPCSYWSTWSTYVDISACSITCGSNGEKTTQRTRTCINDNAQGTGCGPSSTQKETRKESCSASRACPRWGDWTSYDYGECSATCGSGVTQSGVRRRTCINDVFGNRGCGAQSPQTESRTRACNVPLCPRWAEWTIYTYGSCSATCGSRVTQVGTRTRTCLNDISTKMGCGAFSPQTETQSRACSVNPCPQWGLWSPYKDITACSRTCGPDGTKTTERMRVCNNDVDTKDGCGAKSPQSERRTEQCYKGPCPIWGFWSGYKYGPCSKSCGTDGTQVGVRTRICLNDVQSGFGCGQESPQKSQQTRSCTLGPCPEWGPWSGYTPITTCSVTCGPGGEWTTRRTRICNNDISSGEGCGAKSPQSERRTDSCSSSVTCPYWGPWSGFTFTSCSKSCGTDSIRSGRRTRTCLNNIKSGLGCGSPSPQTNDQTQNCQVPSCPFWSDWTSYIQITPCSQTCGPNGVLTKQRTRICNNDIASRRGCGDLSPQKESLTGPCLNPKPCPYWADWTGYTYGPCAATCGRSIVKPATRSRECINDLQSKLGCGAKSPQLDNTYEACSLPLCPQWGIWTPYRAIGSCSVTCGPGGKWTVIRTRECVNDVNDGTGCGARSPQQESKMQSCTSPNNCPYWDSWSGFVYGTCTASCGSATRQGTRYRVCINDNQSKTGCGAQSPQPDVQQKDCRVPQCPLWGDWSQFVPSTPCSVTCGSGGSWKLERRRVCNNDIPAATGCGSKSPNVQTRTESCSSPRQCPAWTDWTSYTFGPCSATCGTGIIKTGLRSRTCVNDVTSGTGCGSKSPQEEKAIQNCQDKACPTWSVWSKYQPIGQCSVTCGPNGVWQTQSSRVCVNDITDGTGCGSKSPQYRTQIQSCPANPKLCPSWSFWSKYSYTPCSVTCGTGSRTGTRTRTCENDSEGNGCGAQSPQQQQQQETCVRPVCPGWSAWTSFRSIGACSVTCGSGGTWKIMRTRQCLNDPNGNGCGAQSPQSEIENQACVSQITCPYWASWSGFVYGRCSATCGTGVTRSGTRTRLCQNDPSGRGCGEQSPQSETRTRVCQVPLCPSWGRWSDFKRVTACSKTCGNDATWKLESKRVCENDVLAGTGCGATSPQTNRKTEACSPYVPCPLWTTWTDYTYGPCSATCGRRVVRTGTKSRTCENDVSSGLGCGKKSPDEETTLVECPFVACPNWGTWTQYTPITACSVTCGPGGTWMVQRQRECENDVQGGNGCGAQSPQVVQKRESCTSGVTCPYWGPWSGYKYGTCSASCGQGVVRNGVRSRVCVNDNTAGTGCGGRSPETVQVVKSCRVPACPRWADWSQRKVMTPCSVTCGTKGFVQVQRRRICENDNPDGKGCGSLSPDDQITNEPCTNPTPPPCPLWAQWSADSLTDCSVTCGRGIRIRSRKRNCVNDIASKLGCGAKSPEEYTNREDCSMGPCPIWSTWTEFKPTAQCSVTCGGGGTWTVLRSRQCINDISSRDGCGANSPQMETKTEGCSSALTCPYWGLWSGFTYGDCSASCGTGITRRGTRSRICRNDVKSGNGCGANSPQFDTQTQDCPVPLCPLWGEWSGYAPSEPCSVTCGSNGVWLTRRERKCSNDIPSRMGCGASSPQRETRRESCGTNKPCPYWSDWSPYTPATACSVTCGTNGGTQVVKRSRTCINDIQEGGGCGVGLLQDSKTRGCFANTPCPGTIFVVWGFLGGFFFFLSFFFFFFFFIFYFLFFIFYFLSAPRP